MAKRVSLSIEQKINLINEVERSIKRKIVIAKEYGIPNSTLSTILKNKDKILNRSKECHNGYKRMRACEYADVDEAMFEWVTTKLKQNVSLTGPVLREKAKEFAEALDHPDFAASSGWLDKFKKRHKFTGKINSNENEDVDLQAADRWIRNTLPTIINDYDPNDIFSADETKVFFKYLPLGILSLKNDKGGGKKRNVDKLSVMVGSNMSGTEKLKLLVVGKPQKPRCFKGLHSLEVDYEHNSRGAMNCEIFEKWLKKLDSKFTSQKRKILLFVDNSPEHSNCSQEKLKSIKLTFFPPRMKSSLQPMNQGTIQMLKQHYRKRILGQVLEQKNSKKAANISLLDATRQLSRSWKDVKAATIYASFKRTGFEQYSVIERDPFATDFPKSDDLAENLIQLWSKYVGNAGDVNLDDFVDEEDVNAVPYPTDEEILQNVIRNHYNIDNGSDQEANEEAEELEEVEIMDLPSFEETNSALRIIQIFAESRKDVRENVFDAIKTLEDFLKDEKSKIDRQANIEE